MDFEKQLSTELIKTACDVASNGLEVLDIAKATYKASQEIKFKVFLRGVRKQLEEQGRLTPTQESKIGEIFLTDFGRDKAEDFIRRAIESNSEIGRVALGALYVKCAARPVPSVTDDDLALLEAYGWIDDALARLVVFLEKTFPKHAPRNSDVLNDQEGYGRLEVPIERFNQLNTEFLTRFNIDGADELDERMETLTRHRVYRSTKHLLGDNSVTFSLKRSRRTSPFILGLRNAIAVLDPGSDLL